MLTGMVINIVIGLACYAGFVLWRGKWVLHACNANAAGLTPSCFHAQP